jgi:hypothetical protein
MCRVEDVHNWIQNQESVCFLVLKKVLKAIGFEIQPQRKRWLVETSYLMMKPLC